MSEKYILENELIKISISSVGAELQEIRLKSNNKNYLWHGDQKYWDGQSPLLFPTVGRVFDDKILIDGKNYSMPKHGFVREGIFRVVEKSSSKIKLELDITAQMKNYYPFDYSLKVVYEIVNKSIKTSWIIENNESNEIYFQIGAHPAINWEAPQNSNIRGYLDFDTSKKYLVSAVANNNGYIVDGEKYNVDLEDGILQMQDKTLFGNTFLFLDNQVSQVTLLNSDKKPYFKLTFNSPTLAIWSPDKEYCPFICIEPWWGLNDKENYNGEFKDRLYTNSAKPNSSTIISYETEILE